MGAPLTEDWYYCPTCGSKVLVGFDGCTICAAREDLDIDSEHPIREADAGLNGMPFGDAKWTDDFETDEFIMSNFHEKSRFSVTPVVIAIALAVFFVVIFLFLSMPRP